LRRKKLVEWEAGHPEGLVYFSCWRDELLRRKRLVEWEAEHRRGLAYFSCWRDEVLRRKKLVEWEAGHPEGLVYFDRHLYFGFERRLHFLQSAFQVLVGIGIRKS
jgi:hypothetical protein